MQCMPVHTINKWISESTNGSKIKLKNVIYCRTSNGVHTITCACDKIYVGQTTQEVRKRIQWHRFDISLAKRDESQENKKLTSVALHFHHHGKPEGFKVIGLDHVKLNTRGGDPIPILLRSESRWIHRLNSLVPDGMNEELLFTGFYKT